MSESDRNRINDLNEQYINLMRKCGKEISELDKEIEEIEARRLRIMQRQQLLNDKPITDKDGNVIVFKSLKEQVKFWSVPKNGK